MYGSVADWKWFGRLVGASTRYAAKASAESLGLWAQGLLDLVIVPRPTVHCLLLLPGPLLPGLCASGIRERMPPEGYP